MFFTHSPHYDWYSLSTILCNSFHFSTCEISIKLEYLELLLIDIGLQNYIPVFWYFSVIQIFANSSNVFFICMCVYHKCTLSLLYCIQILHFLLCISLTCKCTYLIINVTQNILIQFQKFCQNIYICHSGIFMHLCILVSLAKYSVLKHCWLFKMLTVGKSKNIYWNEKHLVQSIISLIYIFLYNFSNEICFY